MLGNILSPPPPLPNIPKDMEQRFERAILQRFSMDFAPFDTVSRDRLDDKTTQHTEYGFFGASGLFISRESKLNSFETWRKESWQISIFDLQTERINSPFIESLFLFRRVSWNDSMAVNNLRRDNERHWISVS